MLVHIGNNSSIEAKDILAVIDADTSTVSKVTRDFLKNAQDENRVEIISDDLPKSFIIAKSKRDSGVRVIASCVSPATIMGRMEKLY